MKILIIGHARHGKDTVAEMIEEEFGLSFLSSSMACAEIFIYNELKVKYGYESFEECFEDRMNHREEWYNMICDYNKDDAARLAKAITSKNDMYVGMRDDREINKSRKDGVFDYIIGVFDPRKPLEPKESFNIDLWKQSDVIIPNAQGLDELRTRIIKVMSPMMQIDGFA